MTKYHRKETYTHTRCGTDEQLLLLLNMEDSDVHDALPWASSKPHNALALTASSGLITTWIK